MTRIVSICGLMSKVSATERPDYSSIKVSLTKQVSASKDGLASLTSEIALGLIVIESMAMEMFGSREGFGAILPRASIFLDCG